MHTTYLDVMGVTLLCLLAYAIWPPAVLGAAGVACLLISWALTQQRKRPE